MPQRRLVTSRSQEPRQRFAEELRKLRAERGVSLRQLGERVGWDYSLFGKMEKGETLGGPEVAQALDHYFGTQGMLLVLWELAMRDRTQFRERYRQYMALESDATSLWHFAVGLLPGLLQTEAYAREVLAAGRLLGEEIEKQVQARLTRRELLDGDSAPQFRSILSETVLRTPLRNRAAWREQLEDLVEMSQRPRVALQVLLHSAGPHSLAHTDVMFLRVPEGRTVAYVEGASKGELIEGTAPVEELQQMYDSVRDLALSPGESRKHILRVLEEVPCDPPS
ncbi:helix-turn-helix domain-containing protein [Streptomyces sp. NPDC090052]|uniref:helix-turn-helix domain-containing protein n=1 Tax=unclassified Streptomyces TaxID=2593676 RepID=UPI002254F96B|nr:helix-turn-helix transcriptional regulator [Streptomyces sp. NBC_01306]MCX4724023.1 helix-turn-helix transcriptional regulator [Streptomyces sp. NBC_01306]WSX44557.1 helix-turn-helix transcriptional regulator [Streptomyces sp. NBC_00963]